MKTKTIRCYVDTANKIQRSLSQIHLESGKKLSTAEFLSLLVDDYERRVSSNTLPQSPSETFKD